MVSTVTKNPVSIITVLTIIEEEKRHGSHVLIPKEETILGGALKSSLQARTWLCT